MKLEKSELEYIQELLNDETRYYAFGGGQSTLQQTYF
ncbi:MAG: hypothetical protein CM15mV88_140 [Caudoviricetes sp.]|nr:MAG: hypothetical protein CM15mV88_140 [Caudoviricetes sp.]